jgi:hypothetical protein
MGRASQRAPHAYTAWADGRLSTDQARHLFRAPETVPERISRSRRVPRRHRRGPRCHGHRQGGRILASVGRWATRRAHR